MILYNAWEKVLELRISIFWLLILFSFTVWNTSRMLRLQPYCLLCFTGIAVLFSISDFHQVTTIMLLFKGLNQRFSLGGGCTRITLEAFPIHMCPFLLLPLQSLPKLFYSGSLKMLPKCCRLNICVSSLLPPPKIRTLKTNSQCDSIWRVFERWFGYESEAVMNGISVLIKEALKSSLTPFAMPCENTVRSWQSPTQKRVLTRTQPCWHPDLGLAASRTVGN